jgi:von Willebrand factor type A domain
MARRRRKFDVFSMSFLDTICCAFGAVVLLYMVINASSGRKFVHNTAALKSQADLIEQQVLEGYQDLAVAKSRLVQTDAEAKRSQTEEQRMATESAELRQQLADAEGTSLSRREAIEKLKADIQAMEEGNRRLEGASKDKNAETGTRVRGFVGDGDRQYLTGLKVGGKHILLLVDVSASMLDETVVNIIRMRNMADSRKILADKWRRTVSIVDWLVSQIPLDSQFQIYAFNTKAWPLAPGTEGKWLESKDQDSLDHAMTALHQAVPAEGTSLENAFAVVMAMNPRPDNVILITDGLPTQGASAPMLKKTVSGDDRLKFFERAWGKYPRNVPLNVIKMPMEGDPSGPSALWVAARTTGGAFMSPSKDWP